MKSIKENIVLIGMPGVGKSTVGVVLAKKLGFRFLDSDIVIQEQEGKLLNELIKENGIEGFWKIEEKINNSIEAHNTIIATGGSAIYGAIAMEHFQRTASIIYLKLSLDSIAKRLGDLNERGVTLKEGQTLPDLYDERIPLYEKYADITINCEYKMIRDIVAEIIMEIEQNKNMEG